MRATNASSIFQRVHDKTSADVGVWVRFGRVKHTARIQFGAVRCVAAGCALGVSHYLCLLFGVPL